MKNKYYTPSIEEFHVGFEYESLEEGSQTKFNKDIVTDNHLYGDYEQNTLLSELYFHPERARVKYLDQEDIESLGFEVSPSEHNPLYWHIVIKNDPKDYMKSIVGYYDFTSKELSLENLGSYEDHKYYVKDIIVKNKSELKKLLKQLNIQNENS